MDFLALVPIIHIAQCIGLVAGTIGASCAPLCQHWLAFPVKLVLAGARRMRGGSCALRSAHARPAFASSRCLVDLIEFEIIREFAVEGKRWLKLEAAKCASH